MLTERQQQIFDFICAFKLGNGSAPTIAEIQARFQFRSPTTVSEHLEALERRGVIRRAPGQARNIRIVTEGTAAPSLTIPVFGSIPAGFAEAVEGQPARTIAFDATSLRVSRNARLFGLDVRGDSMIGAGILDGDLVILENGPLPKNGDIVAALIDRETTLKRFRTRNGRPFLQAENPTYPDLMPVDELQVQGIYRALVRVPKGGRHEAR